MFQGLSQGATIPVLFRNVPRVADGRVVSVSTHMPTYNPQQPMAIMNGPVTDITVQVGNDTIPFAGLPASGVVANFPEKGLFIATENSAIVRELEAMAAASEQILESVPSHEKMVRDCKALIAERSPERKRDQELAAMRTEMEELRTLLRQALGQKNNE